MKRCPMCGESYDERVDFCFEDGTPLVSAFENEAANAPAPQASAPQFDGLDAPDPENISGLDAPDPLGVDWGEAAEAPAPSPVVTTPVVEEAPAPEAPTIETVQVAEPEQLPAGYNEPPSQGFGIDSSNEEAPWNPNDDDLDFPSDFGFGDEGGFGEFTEPTIPAPKRQSAGGAKKFVAAALVLVIGGLGFALKGGGDSSDMDGQILAAKPTAEVVAPVQVPSTPDPIREPVPVTEDFDEPSELEEDALEADEELEDAEDGTNADAAEEAPDPEPDPAPASNPQSESAASTPTRIVEPTQPQQPAAEAEEASSREDVNAVEEVDPWGSEVVEPATSRVRVFSKPSGATLYVDGRALGSTPAELDLDPGNHSIRVEKDGFFAESRTVEISGPTHLERFELRAESQPVTVNCYGPDASKVYLDGKVVCAIPGSGTVVSGQHTFRVVTPDRFFRVSIDVQRKSDGSPTPLRFTE